jgi:hypothetical protein
VLDGGVGSLAEGMAGLAGNLWKSAKTATATVAVQVIAASKPTVSILPIS